MIDMRADYLRHAANMLQDRLSRPRLRKLRAAVAVAPLDPDRHAALSAGLAGAGRFYAAHAALRSEAFLRGRASWSPPVVEQYRTAARELLAMEHNQFFRFKTLSDAVRALTGSAPVSILDVGGGDGQLAQFLPEYGYFLAEPSVNGVSAENLPFDEAAFDYVVSCHVLEHVPPNRRAEFLDALMRRARHGLVLLNPFHDARTAAEERLRLFIKITGAEWAKEHLECTLPELDTVRHYAAERGLAIECRPSGFLPLSTALVFANHFCTRFGRLSDFCAINEYFNVRLSGLLDSAEWPNAYLITLTRR